MINVCQYFSDSVLVDVPVLEYDDNGIESATVQCDV